MATIDSLFLFLGLGAAWLTIVLITGFWLIKKTVPTLIKDMKDSGLSDSEIQKEMTTVAFPPKFHK